MLQKNRYRIVYLLTILIFGAASYGFLEYFQSSVQSKIALFVLLLIPGRFQAFLFGEFYLGRRHLSENRLELARESFMRFLDKLQARPWIRHGIWLAGARYTRSIEAMTRNNLGVCLLKSEEPQAAHEQLQGAVSLDPNYAVAHFNLGLAAHSLGDDPAAQSCFGKAKELGFSLGPGEKLCQELKELYSRIQSQNL